mmetsp:Transcript_52511/g.104191  ORF Transcript_52511/g.104191 Transcript_52511/m.104191 type:complete len:137 (+) Transcript_52511:37-447(+)
MLHLCDASNYVASGLLQVGTFMALVQTLAMLQVEPFLGSLADFCFVAIIICRAACRILSDALADFTVVASRSFQSALVDFTLWQLPSARLLAASLGDALTVLSLGLSFCMAIFGPLPTNWCLRVPPRSILNLPSKL